MDTFFYISDIEKSDYPTETEIIPFVKDVMKENLYEHSSPSDCEIADVVEIVDRKFPTFRKAGLWLSKTCKARGPVLIVSTDTLWVFGALRASEAE